MSGVNPLLAQTAASGAIDSTTAILQAIAADAAALNALLQEGDVFQATVLPFNGVTDLIEAFGLQVPASLPPGIYPGEQIELQVQGFQGDQIMVKLVGTQPVPPGTVPNAPPATLELTPTPVPVVVDPELLPPNAPTPGQPGAAGTAAPPGATLPPPILPRGSIPPILPRTPVPSANAAPAAVRAAPAAPPSAESLSVEARLALTRATLLAPQRTPPLERGAPTPLPPVPPRQAAPPASSNNAPQQAGRAPGTPQPPIAVTRPAYLPIAERGTVDTKPAAPVPGAPVPVRGPLTVPAPPPGVRLTPVNASSLLSDPAALLRTLRIPVTPTSLAFAKLATTQPEQVATALRALESGLPESSSDPRVLTLRTLAAFVGTLDPKSPTFPTQVASFMSHVAEGPEPKLLAALAQAEPLPGDTPAATGDQAETAQAGAGTNASAATASAPAASAQAAAAPPAPAVPIDPSALAAQSVMRTAAAAADLKTLLLSVLATPGGSDNLVGNSGTALVQNALTALASSQLNSLASQQTGSGSWTFTIPIAIDQQLYPAKILVDRDAPDAKKPLTGDDFHIAFILETQHLGTVAIDVRAVGRAVNVAVKTEREIAATSFKQSLAKLGERLEAMRYNVKSLEAGALPVRISDATSETEAKDEGPPTDPNALMDKRA